MSLGKLVLLKAIASGKKWLFELNESYLNAGFGQRYTFKSRRYSVRYSMACGIQLRRLCGLEGGVPLARRVKEVGPRGKLQWSYYLTEEGKQALKEN